MRPAQPGGTGRGFGSGLGAVSAHLPATHAASAGGGDGQGEQPGGGTGGVLGRPSPVERPNVGDVPGASPFSGGSASCGVGFRRASSAGTAALTGQHPHGDAWQAAPGGGDVVTTVQSAALRHSATSVVRRATHRPASHTARKLLAGSGTTIAHAASSQEGDLHRSAAQRCCAAFKPDALIA
ncbi:MAG: hypothetical protein AB1730_04655 [Myxococcota bacterium]